MTILCALGWWIADAADIEYWHPRTRKDSLIVHAYIHEERPADVLCIGSSRTQSGLPALVLERALSADEEAPVRVYNAGQKSAYVVTQDIVLRDIVTERRRPRLVLFEVGVASLNSSSRDLLVCLRRFASPVDAVRLAPDLRSMNDAEVVLAALFRGVSVTAERILHGPEAPETRERLETIRRQRGGRILKVPWGGSLSMADTSAEDRERRWRKLAKNTRRHRLRRYRIEGAADAALRRSVAHCRALGVDIVFLVMPTADRHRELFRNGEDVTFAAYIRAVSAELDVPLIDPRTAGLSFGDDELRDHHHLNDRGAEKLCRWLAGRLPR